MQFVLYMPLKNDVEVITSRIALKWFQKKPKWVPKLHHFCRKEECDLYFVHLHGFCKPKL